MNELSIDIGKELRVAREALGHHIGVLSSELCISKRQLLALEENRSEDLPGPTYAIGFLRVYADRLGLDADALCHSYRLKFGDVDLTPQLHFPEPLPETGIPALSVLVSGSLALAGIYMGWSALSGGSTAQANLVPAPPAHLVALVEGDSSDSLTKPEITAVAEAESIESQPEEETQPVYQLASAEESATVAVTDPIQPETVAPIEQPQPQGNSGVVKSAFARVPPATVSYEGGRSGIQILALQDTWVMITDKDEHLLMEGIIRSGERYTPPAIPGLRLTTSNAGGLELTLDGRTLEPLGEKGAVVRSVLLDPRRRTAGGAP